MRSGSLCVCVCARLCAEGSWEYSPICKRKASHFVIGDHYATELTSTYRVAKRLLAQQQAKKKKESEEKLAFSVLCGARCALCEVANCRLVRNNYFSVVSELVRAVIRRQTSREHAGKICEHKNRAPACLSTTFCTRFAYGMICMKECSRWWLRKDGRVGTWKCILSALSCWTS